MSKVERLDVAEATLCCVPCCVEGEADERFIYPKRVFASKPRDG